MHPQPARARRDPKSDASRYVAAVDPTELPVELRAAIESPFAGVREGAVTELARLAAASDPGLAAAARAALGDLERDDSRSVAAAASAALRVEEPAPLTEPSPQPVLAPPAAPAPPAIAPLRIASVADVPASRSRRRSSAHAAFVPLALAALGALLVIVG